MDTVLLNERNELIEVLRDLLNDCINFDNGNLSKCIMEKASSVLMKYSEVNNQDKPKDSFISDLVCEYNNRGFAYYQFRDLYENNCSLQKSSLATCDAIWLGVNDDQSNRMHLSQDCLRKLMPIFKRFLETGDIDE